MITQQFTLSNSATPHGIQQPSEVAQILSDGAKKLLRRQQFIATHRYLIRSGNLKDTLDSNPYTITTSGNGNPILTLQYPFYIRFLDLQRSATGAKKKRHYPIYNKLIYGFLMGYTYGRLRQGLSTSLNESFQTITKTKIEL